MTAANTDPLQEKPLHQKIVEALSGSDALIGHSYVTAIQTLIENEKRKARIEELRLFKDYSYNLGFRGDGMGHLDARIKALEGEGK